MAASVKNLQKIDQTILLKKNLWEKIIPCTTRGKDERLHTNFSGPWTDVLYFVIYDALKLPCPYAFKKNQFFKKSGYPYFYFYGYCYECGNTLSGHCWIEPDLSNEEAIPIEILTYDTSSIVHDTRRNISRDIRLEAGKELLHTHPRHFKDKLAGQNLNNSSGRGIELMHNTYIYQGIRQEAIKIDLGLDKYPGSPISSVLLMMNDYPALKDFSTVPFGLPYWTDKQLELFRESVKFKIPISIDAAGRFVTRISVNNNLTAAIFLYEIVIRINAHIYPLAQFLTEKQDVITLSTWFSDWLEDAGCIPHEIIVDCSLALLNTLTFSANGCFYPEYSEKLFKALKENNPKLLPPCIIRRDRNHLMGAAGKWKCFSSQRNWAKKNFYIKVIGYSLRVISLTLFEDIVKSLFVICMSEGVSSGSECEKRTHWLLQKIASFNYDDYYPGTMDSPEFQTLIQDQQENDDLFKDDDKNVDESQTLYSYIDNLYNEAMLLVDNNKNDSNTMPNRYYLPNILDNLVDLYRQFPVWTNALLALDSSLSENPTSTGSENYFRSLRYQHEMNHPTSLPRFLLSHLRIIDGPCIMAKNALTTLEDPQVTNNSTDDKKSLFNDTLYIQTYQNWLDDHTSESSMPIDMNANASLMNHNDVDIVFDDLINDHSPIVAQDNRNNSNYDQGTDMITDEAINLISTNCSQSPIINSIEHIGRNETFPAYSFDNDNNVDMVIEPTIENLSAIEGMVPSSTALLSPNDKYYHQDLFNNTNKISTPITSTPTKTISEDIKQRDKNIYNYILQLMHISKSLIIGKYECQALGSRFLSVEDFYSVNGTELLSNNIIDVFLSLKDKYEWRNVSFMPMEWTEVIFGNGTLRLSNSKLHSFSMGKEYKNLVFMPYLFKGQHNLVILNLKLELFIHYDPNKETQGWTGDRAAGCFKNYLDLARATKDFQSILTSIYWKPVIKILPDTLPAQSENNIFDDSGIYILYYMEVIASSLRDDLEFNIHLSDDLKFDIESYKISLINFFLRYRDHNNMKNLCLKCTKLISAKDSTCKHCKVCKRGAHKKCSAKIFFERFECFLCHGDVDHQSTLLLSKTSSIDQSYYCKIGFPNPYGTDKCWINSAVRILCVLPVFNNLSNHPDIRIADSELLTSFMRFHKVWTQGLLNQETALRMIQDFKIKSGALCQDFSETDDQQDVSEFFILLLDHLDLHCDKVSNYIARSVDKHYFSSIEEDSECVKCDHSIKTCLQNSCMLQITLDEFDNSNTVLDVKNLIESQVLLTSRTSTCHSVICLHDDLKTGRNTLHRVENKFMRLPNVLPIVFKRFFTFHDGKEMIVEKKEYSIQVDEDLILHEYSNLVLTPRNVHYELIGVICHEGLSAISGHYYSYVKHGNKWLYYNDKDVQETNANFLDTIQSTVYIIFYKQKAS